MKYMLMIFDSGDWVNDSTAEQIAASMEAHGAFAAYLAGRGAEFTGEALHDQKTGTTIKPDGNGGHVVTDGPHVTLKEYLSGYYIIEAADLDDAIEVAKHCPAELGLELRPVVEFSS